ncbi:hypothetical protein [uncultured Roseovarius sp.]|uniref:esterase/lipase family protein n=1 Tax=uncultured Roseovarius sp. TaxID=293344 RepID=UPI0026258F20|nr:hypothetical protein [uncultured Roseovarius sp.]
MSQPYSYFETVHIESMDMIDEALDVFFQNFDPNQPTIVLLPGGLGSALRQSRSAFNGFPQPPSAFRRVIWVNMGLLFGEALRLPIDADGFDTKHKIVVADGDIDYCLVHPYSDAVRYFRDHLCANVLVMGWDWRRKVMTSVDYLAQTLTEMSARALNMTGQNILQNTHLIGHSMGGMVAKLLMSSQPHLAKDLQGMISVGSPFYGYFGQLDRFYNGVEYFNMLYSAPVVAKITSSWPGMYSLLPIDEMTYDHSHKAIGLTSYPVVDSESGKPVDPYSSSSFSRYPKWTRTGEIPRGFSVRQVLAAPLQGSLGEKVFHLRVNEADTTQSSAIWEPKLPPHYVPGHSPSPVKFGLGAGDGTIPVWSAALASTPKANITDFATGSHAFLMEEPEILAKIANIITGKTVDASAIEELLTPREDFATPDETAAIILGIQSGEITPSRPYDPDGKLIVPPNVLRRMMADYGL